MPNYTQANFNLDVANSVSGSYSAAVFLRVANQAVRDVLADVDLRSTRRKSALDPNLFDDVFEYTMPSDLKARKIIDIQPQKGRNYLDSWTLVFDEEFDRYKQETRVDRYGDRIVMNKSYYLGDNLVAFSHNDFMPILKLSSVIDDKELIISNLDSATNWTAVGDAENIEADTDNYIKGSGSIKFDIDAAGGTTAGITNSSVGSYDLTDYLTEGSVFVWAYISSATNLTNYILRIGSGSGAYYSMTATTRHDGNSFTAGWNLIRFDMSGKSTTGTVVYASCDYVSLYMTKDGAKISETDYRFDYLTMRLGAYYNLIYYTKYLWQTNAAVYLENATATTDVLNVETDEYNLILLKTSERMEKYLRNHQEASNYRQDYAASLQKYEIDNPSESMITVQKYYNL